MKVAIIGSRTFNDYDRLETTLDMLSAGFGFNVVVSGGADGADSLAEQYADNRHLNRIIHLPKWQLHGKAAGMIRNRDIIDDADVVVAFWDGKSRGTKNSMNLAKEQKKTTIIIYF